MGHIAKVLRASIPLIALFPDDDDAPTGWHIYTCNAIIEIESERKLPPHERGSGFPARDWYFNWLHEFMHFVGTTVPVAFFNHVENALPAKERQEIRLMLLCFAALQAEDLGI
jgi:hypothetical protein